MDALIPIGVTVLVIAVIMTGLAVLIARFYRKVDQGQALIINRMQDEPIVTFTGGVVVPIFHRAEVMNISVKTIEIERRGKEGLICKDNIRADIKVTFFVRVNKTAEDVLKVAQAIGCARASEQATLEELFVAKFSEALKTVGKRLDFEGLYTQRDVFKDQIIEVIGRDLNGYVLEDAAIDYLEQTPIELLDKDNILDSQGIRKITEMTAIQHVKTNDLRQHERKELSRQNLEADEAVLELEKRRADAEARQKREIATIQAREQAETAQVQVEESKKTQLATIKANEELELSNLAKSRQVEIALRDKDRVVAIKSEQVEKDRQMEIISREREVELQRIDKEKALEKERKEIAEVVRTRIAVDRNVKEEEERIKTMQANAEADRAKSVVITAAEARAQEALIARLREAEAREKVAEFQAKERLILANAALESAEKEAQAKIRLSEGVQAERAAEGLAAARVHEAEAVALEKSGLVEARITREKLAAEAEGLEKKGIANATVRTAEADAAQKLGLAEAEVTREKLAAEAAGIAAKMEAMQKMDAASRAHEEFRLNVEKDRQIAMAEIQARASIASANASILASAFANADIKIVGGGQNFAERFSQAVGLGQMIDGAVADSAVLSSVVKAVEGPLKAKLGEMMAGKSDENEKA